MNRSVAEIGLAGQSAPMEQVHVVLPGKADAAMDLDRLAGDILAHIRGVGFRHRHRGRGLRGPFIHGPASVVSKRAGIFDRHHHVHAFVLDRLESADRLAELNARFSIIDRHVQRALRGPDNLRAQSGGGDIQGAVQDWPALVFRPEQLPAASTSTPSNLRWQRRRVMSTVLSWVIVRPLELLGTRNRLMPSSGLNPLGAGHYSDAIGNLGIGDEEFLAR